MKRIRVKNKVLLNFSTEDKDIFIGKIQIIQNSEIEYMNVSFSFFKYDEGVPIEIRSFKDKYDRSVVNNLTIDLITNQTSSPIGLFDLIEKVYLSVAIDIIDSSKLTNKYLGLSREDLEIIDF